MPLLQVHLLEGRSEAVKAALMKDLTEVVQRRLGSDSDRISILISEYAEGTWSVGGEPLRRGEVVTND